MAIELPPGAINTVPQGLLGMLALKQLGKNPDQLLTTVSPTLDLFAFYSQRLGEELVLSGSDVQSVPTAAPGIYNFTTVVPTNQAWWIERMTIAGTLLAAETITYCCCVKPVGVAGVPHQVSPYFADIITARARAFRTTGGGFWMPPGAFFSAHVVDVLTGATIALNLGVRGFRAIV